MEIHDVSEYIHWNISRPEFYIQNILPKQGSMLLCGTPGVRKSWLVEYIGFCIASGDECLGFGTEQARVLIINFEISSAAYHWRLRDMGQRFNLQPQMLFEASPSLLFLEERGTFERFAADVRPVQPKIIVLDCLSACFGGDENNSREMSGFIHNVVELKNEHEASIIIVHHSNKNPMAISSIDRVRGHTRLPGWVDTVVYMVEQPSGTQLQFSKARQSLRILHPINVQFENYVWTRR